MSVDWTDALKEQVVEMYLSEQPTAETSAEIVKEIAEEIDKTTNAVRGVLTSAGVYVKKSVTEAKEKSTRVSKQDAINDLIKAIKEKGKTVDEDILNRLTGKAAVYIKSLL